MRSVSVPAHLSRRPVLRRSRVLSTRSLCPPTITRLARLSPCLSAEMAPPSSSNGKKQSTLLGFFSKQPGPSSSSPSGPPSSSRPKPAPPSSSASKPASSALAPTKSLPLNSSPLAAVSRKLPPVSAVSKSMVVDVQEEDADGDVTLEAAPPSPPRPVLAGPSSSRSSSVPKTSVAQSERAFDEDANMDEDDEDHPVLSVSAPGSAPNASAPV